MAHTPNPSEQSEPFDIVESIEAVYDRTTNLVCVLSVMRVIRTYAQETHQHDIEETMEMLMRDFEVHIDEIERHAMALRRSVPQEKWRKAFCKRAAKILDQETKDRNDAS